MKEIQSREFPEGIPACGTDALRFALCSYVASGKDINLDVRRVHTFRLFCNKIWNAAKYVLSKCEGQGDRSASAAPGHIDRWILSRLDAAVEDTNHAFV